MKEKALNLLGLMRKANAVCIGETETGTAVREHEAKLVILASDASENARRRAESYLYESKAPLITVPFTKAEISSHVGKCGCSMAALCDIGFADAFMKLLCEISPEDYNNTAQIIRFRFEESKRRKAEKSLQNKKRTYKRRNNA